MKKYITTIWLLFVLINGSMVQQPVYSGKEFKPLHGLTGLWKMESQRGAIYEEVSLYSGNCDLSILGIMRRAFL
jgi:hypothetical protein